MSLINLKMDRLTFFKIYLVCLVLLCSGYEIHAQDKSQELILAGPDRTLIVVQGAFMDQNEGSSRRLSAQERIIVERADNGSRNFKKIGEAQFPTSASVLAERLGGFSADVLQKLNVKTINEAYRILSSQTVDTLGILLMSVHIQEALGITFIDTNRNPKRSSVYKLTKNGGKASSEVLLNVSAQLPIYPERFRFSNLSTSDSSLSVIWKASSNAIQQTFPLVAKIYKQGQARGTFQEYMTKYVANSVASIDTMEISLVEAIDPGNNIGFYIQLEDLAGNKGIPSDTVYTVSVARSKIKPITSLTTIDTLGAVLLTWDAIPDEAVYGGIQILKSRKVNSDFVVLDTVPITDTSYWDHQIISGTSYHYRVRPLLLNIPNSDPMMFAEAVANIGVKDSEVPSMPTGLKLKAVEKGVEVSWQNGPELNLFGYYVLRGTSDKDMEVIANAVQEHSFVDTLMIPGYSGQLHYAVQAISQNQMVSDRSELVSIAVKQAVHLNPPGGLQARKADVGVMLNWENAMQRDDRILGYIVYRKLKNETKFSPINAEIHNLPFYSDSTVLAGTTYEYAVSSIDAWGNQSVLSETSKVLGDNTATLVLPLELYLRNLSSGIEIFWPSVAVTANERYVIYRRTNTQVEFRKIGQSNPDVPYVDKDIQPNQLYEYLIKVSNGGVEQQNDVRGSIRRN